MLRTIAIPVAEVIDGGTKAEFYADLNRSLDLARRAANKAVSACLQADQELMTGGKLPKLYTYHAVAGAFPGVTKIASSICGAVQSKYTRERQNVANGRSSVCVYRSFPWVLLHNKSAKTLEVDTTGEFVTVRIKLLGGWWTVRLAGGSDNAIKIAGLKSALSIGDSKIWVNRKHKAIIGFSVDAKPKPIVVGKGTLAVSTSRDHLLVATKEKTDVPFVITGDDLRNWASARDRVYQRLRQDRKSGKSRQALNAKLRSVGDKWKRRFDSYMHEVSAKVVKHAIRRKCNKIVFDGTIKSFGSFPWHDLKTKLAYKCENHGIEFVDVTQQVPEPDINKPHIYFKLSPTTHRVKIGKTGREDGGRHGAETDSPEELIILAVDNQPKNKLTMREKHFHAYFADHRAKGEWFDGEPVIHWLREAGWLGNAGNLSQIAQVLPVEDVPPETASSGRECECASGNDPDECSQSRITGEDIPELIGTDLAATKQTVCS